MRVVLGNAILELLWRKNEYLLELTYLTTTPPTPPHSHTMIASLSVPQVNVTY